MNTVNDTPKVEVKKTGEIKTAVYAANLRGNMQFWVDGKFYNDVLFNRYFKILPTKQ